MNSFTIRMDIHFKWSLYHLKSYTFGIEYIPYTYLTPNQKNMTELEQESQLASYPLHRDPHSKFILCCFILKYLLPRPQL